MTPIIAGRFEQKNQAEAAVAALRRGGFGADDVTLFFGDTEEKSAAAKSDERVAPLRPSVLVAVRAVEFAKRVAAVNVLRAEGARDIERARRDVRRLGPAAASGRSARTGRCSPAKISGRSTAKIFRSDRTSAIPIDEGQPFEFYE